MDFFLRVSSFGHAGFEKFEAMWHEKNSFSIGIVSDELGNDLWHTNCDRSFAEGLNFFDLRFFKTIPGV